MGARAITLVAAAVAAACGSTAFAERDRTAVATLDQLFRASVKDQDWAALERVYADSAVLLPPNATVVRGRENIQVWFSSRGYRINAFESTLHELDGSGDVAYARGTYLLTFRAPGARNPVTETGKFVWILRRPPGGEWRVTLDAWNADPTR